MNFRIQELDGAHCRLTTETLVYAAGFHLVHGFAAYWRMIYPGSSLIRHMWLRAIKLRAEGAEATRSPATSTRVFRMKFLCPIPPAKERRHFAPSVN
jgi:hypothetical protein